MKEVREREAAADVLLSALKKQTVAGLCQGTWAAFNCQWSQSPNHRN